MLAVMLCYAMPCHAMPMPSSSMFTSHVHNGDMHRRSSSQSVLRTYHAGQEHRARRAGLQEHTRAHEPVHGRKMPSPASCNRQASQGLGHDPAHAMHTVGGQRPVNVNKCMQRSGRPALHIVCHGDCGTLDGAYGV